MSFGDVPRSGISITSRGILGHASDFTRRRVSPHSPRSHKGVGVRLERQKSPGRTRKGEENCRGGGVKAGRDRPSGLARLGIPLNAFELTQELAVGPTKCNHPNYASLRAPGFVHAGRGYSLSVCFTDTPVSIQGNRTIPSRLS